MFKTHHPDNRLVGGGFFEHYTVLRASEAWAFMGTGKGATTLAEMLARIRRYRPQTHAERDCGDRLRDPQRPAVLRRSSRGRWTAVLLPQHRPFQAVVLDAYGARCAITRHRIRPTLQAAHIRPVTEGGPHDVANGLLLRSDVHTMFDRGYLALTDDHRLLVSPRLREDYENGVEFYEPAGSAAAVPRIPGSSRLTV